jgi:hypothetical protein
MKKQIFDVRRGGTAPLFTVTACVIARDAHIPPIEIV